MLPVQIKNEDTNATKEIVVNTMKYLLKMRDTWSANEGSKIGTEASSRGKKTRQSFKSGTLSIILELELYRIIRKH